MAGIEPLKLSAPLALRLAPRLCRDCAWFHGLWQVLRLLGLNTTPEHHARFFRERLRRECRALDRPRVLISGTADYSLLAHLLPEEYDGGELTVHDSFGAHRAKLAAGSMVLYPGNTVHEVTPVSRGMRLAAILWIQSMVRDEAQRRILFELDLALGGLRQKLPAAGELNVLTATYHNLLRLWSET